MKETLAVIAALLAIVGNAPYLWNMVRGNVRPHPYTWLVGSIVSGTVFFGMFEKGAGIGSLPVAVSEICTVIIFLFSLRYGFGGTSKSDKIFLAIALAGLVPWAMTKDPTLSVIIAVAVDVVSFIPTFRKTWQLPHTEHAALYAANVSRHILLLFSLQTYNVATMLHSIAMIITNTGMLAVISRNRLSRSFR